MKLNGIIGKGSGKLGSAVFAISGGEQIVRQYNPQVSNPSTDAQVQQRAKLKLMSQLAASMAPAIVIPKKGLRSARNQFVSKNIGMANYSGSAATIQLGSIQLTDGTTYIPEPNPTSETAGLISLALSEAAANNIKAVVYAVFAKIDGQQLDFVGHVTISEAGANRLFSAQIAAPAGECVVYAYGIKESDGANSVAFDNYLVEEGSNLASLETLKNIIALSGGVTKTAGAEVVVS